MPIQCKGSERNSTKVARPLDLSAVGHGAGWKSGCPGSDEPHPGQRVLAAVRKAWLDTPGAGDGRTGNGSNGVVARPGSAKPRTPFSDALAGWPRRDAGPVERRDLPVSEGRPTGDCFREEWAGFKARPVPTAPTRPATAPSRPGPLLRALAYAAACASSAGDPPVVSGLARGQSPCPGRRARWGGGFPPDPSSYAAAYAAPARQGKSGWSQPGPPLIVSPPWPRQHTRGPELSGSLHPLSCR
jgi:hypothetical protein